LNSGITEPRPVLPSGAASPPLPVAAAAHPQWRRYAWVAGALALPFGPVLYELVRFALASDLYSHTLLMPVVAGYFVWLARPELPAPGRAAWGPALMVTSVAVALVAWSLVGGGSRGWSVEDRLAARVGAYVLLIAGAGFVLVGTRGVRAVAFSLGLLVFAFPMPTALTKGVEVFLQHGSAEVAHVLFNLTGTPNFRTDLLFQLPRISLMVAPECSGIHSSLALFITSLVAGKLFLRASWRRILLAVIVVPLALLRNGFRILTIGLLCVHIGPHMINSVIHHQGGPIFFALSLLPFGALLWWLRRAEIRVPTPQS
jgi:exosortase C (VPDSG-CTERM-specific)